MHHIDVFTFYVSVLLHIHNSNLASQSSRPMCSTWWCVRGSSGSMWTRGKIWLQTSLFISHRYSIKHTLRSASFYSFSAHRIVMIQDWRCASIQELPKYLRGHHNCTKEDMIDLGGLLFRVQVDSDRSQFVMIPKMLKELVPADQIKSASPEEWKKVKGDTSICLRKWKSIFGGGTRRDEALTWLGWPLLFSLLFLLLAAHHLLLQQAEWHHGERGQNRLPESHFKLANIRLCLLWS